MKHYHSKALLAVSQGGELRFAAIRNVIKEARAGVGRGVGEVTDCLSPSGAPKPAEHGLSRCSGFKQHKQYEHVECCKALGACLQALLRVKLMHGGTQHWLRGVFSVPWSCGVQTFSTHCVERLCGLRQLGPLACQPMHR